MKKVPVILVLTVFLLLIPTFAGAATDWKALKTEYFTVFYQPGFEEQAKEVLQTLEYYRPEVEKLTGNRRLHLPVVINDLGIITNGQASPYLNWVQLFWYPPEAGLIGTVEDWNAMVAVHEYTHILQMTNVGKGPQVLCRLFGDILSPNVYIPGWMVEGITVYSESRLWDYQGRLNDGKYDAYIGARVADGRFPSIVDATFDPFEFQLEGIYTFGGVFFNFLAKEYGEEKLTEFFNARGSSWDSLDKNAKKVFGKSFPQLWEEWKSYENERFKDFYIDGEQVTKHGWSVSDPFIVEGSDGTGKLYYKKTKQEKTGVNNVFYSTEIIERNLSTQEEQVIISTTSSFVLPLKVTNNKLYYGVYEQKPGYANAWYQGYGGYALLREKDLASGKEQLVLSGEIRAYDLLPDGRILYAEAKREGFGSKVYLFTPEEGSELLYDLDYLIDEIAVDGERILFVARESRKNTDLFLFSLATGELKPLISTPYAEYGVSLSGEQVFFHANYDQIYSIYCYDFSDNKVYQMTTGGYATYPVFNKEEEDLYFIGLNSYGFDFYRKAAVFNEYKLPEVSPEVWPELSWEELDIQEGGYWENVKTLTPKVILPNYYLEQDKEEIGLTFLGSDAVGNLPLYQLGVNYDLKQKKWGLDATFQLNFFPPLGIALGYNRSQERPFNLDVNYPLLVRLSPGVSQFTLGSSVNYGHDQGTEITPYASLGFQFPRMRASFNLAVPIEDKSWGNDTQRIGYYGELMVEQNCLGGELLLKADAIYDPENQDKVFPRIRGYRKALTAKKGGVYTAEYSRTLLPVRKGSWFFRSYLEELCTSLFVDAAVPTEGKYQLSYGLELYQEIKIDFGLMIFMINPGIGIGFDHDGNFFTEIVLKGWI
jgi:hypothetical protein